jgi:hypothetical protein
MRRFLAVCVAKKLAAERFEADVQLAIKLSLASEQANKSTSVKPVPSVTHKKAAVVKKACWYGSKCKFGAKCKFSHPVATVDTPKDEVASSGKECPICFEIMDEKVATNCGHVFCGNCADKIGDKCFLCGLAVASKIKLYF